MNKLTFKMNVINQLCGFLAFIALRAFMNPEVSLGEAMIFAEILALSYNFLDVFREKQ